MKEPKILVKLVLHIDRIKYIKDYNYIKDNLLNMGNNKAWRDQTREAYMPITWRNKKITHTSRIRKLF